jgi:hypothetical protein
VILLRPPLMPTHPRPAAIGGASRPPMPDHAVPLGYALSTASFVLAWCGPGLSQALADLAHLGSFLAGLAALGMVLLGVHDRLRPRV